MVSSLPGQRAYAECPVCRVRGYPGAGHTPGLLQTSLWWAAGNIPKYQPPTIQAKEDIIIQTNVFLITLYYI